MSQPCPEGVCASWITADDLCGPCLDLPDPDSDASLTEAMLMASDIVYMASGREYPGTCREVVRPCATDRSARHSYACSSSCGCTPFRQVELGFTPVTSIVSVTLCDPSNPAWRADGSGTCVLDSSLYHIDEFHYLVRDPDPDGRNPGWPSCSSMSPDTTAEGTFEVDFTYGRAPTSSLKRAAAILACETYMACNTSAFEDGECRLPRQVVSIVRQGVSVVLESAFFTPQAGKPIQFGIPEIDLAISLANPHGLSSRMEVLSPDSPEIARRVNT